jgi:hypothetical protein
MRDAGLWQTRAARRRAIQQPRARRQYFGELIQIDGSEHHWFEDRGPYCTVLTRRSILPYRRAAAMLGELLPISDEVVSHATLRRHALAVGASLMVCCVIRSMPDTIPA